ncbi:hypothetical protein RUND412_009941 [Rhizina undulata]
MASTSKTPAPVLDADPNFNSTSDYETSNYGSSLESSTTSLITAAKNHGFENGRRYHGYKEGKYWLPNDEAEQDRLDLWHHCCQMALRGELFTCPLGKESEPEPQRILDIGTGTGIWAIDIADQFPSAEVIGVDLSPIQPNWVPPNLSFEVDDIEEIWSYKESSFDFIHIRCLYRQAFKALKPGGWIEVQDFCDFFSYDDESLPADSILHEYCDNYEETSAHFGREWNAVAPGVKIALADVGYIELTEKMYKFPCGRWPKGKPEKDLGMYWRQSLFDGVEAFTLAFARTWAKKDIDDFVAGFKAELTNPKLHTYSKFYCTYGRKLVERENSERKSWNCFCVRLDIQI